MEQAIGEGGREGGRGKREGGREWREGGRRGEEGGREGEEGGREGGRGKRRGRDKEMRKKTTGWEKGAMIISKEKPPKLSTNNITIITGRGTYV